MIVRRRSLPWVLFALALAAAVAFATLWRVAARRADETERERAEVVGAATRFLGALTNFSAATISRDVAEIRSFAVGDFAAQVRQFFGPQAVAAIREANAKSTGRVQSVFVQSLDGTSASVFGVVNETVTNANSPLPRSEILRLDVEMIDTTAGWRVNRVEILQSPAEGPFGGGGG